MSYHLTRNDGSVEKGLRRIALDQIDAAIAEVDDGDLDAHATVHQARKRCKKLRGLVRLVRPSFKDYAAENAAFRDAADELGDIRDSEAAVETYDKLLRCYGDQIDPSAFASIRDRLAARRRKAGRGGRVDERLSGFRATMVVARRRAEAWTIEDDGFAAVSGGLGKTYKRARKAMRRACDDPTAAKLHAWRKRVKYHWYHARLMREIWPEVVGAHRDAADALGELLGEHHDLAVLEATVREAPRAFGRPTDLDVFAGLIGRRRGVLAAEAFSLGPRLLAEKPGALLRRWDAYWRAWRSQETARERAAAA